MYIGRISKFVAYFYLAVWPKQVLNNNQLIINYEQSTNWIDVDNEQSGHGKNIAWWIMNCLGVELSRSSQLVPKILTTYINLQQTYDLITNFSILKSLESLRHRDQIALILKDLHVWSFLFYFFATNKQLRFFNSYYSLQRNDSVCEPTWHCELWFLGAQRI